MASGTMICLPGILVIIIALATIVAPGLSAQRSNPGARAGFFNHTGCLYAFVDGGNFQMTTADGDSIGETLNTESLSFESNKARCASQTQSGKLVLSFDLNQKKIKSVTISMRILLSELRSYWEINQANLTVTRADIDRKRTFPLKLPNIYATSDYSYSCNELVLHTKFRKKPDNETRPDPRAKITLKRFQLQPFEELPNFVFAPSYDCSRWMTIPGYTGLILVLFMTIVTTVGTVCLKRIETNDFKYNREGLLFTQSQIESSKRQ